MKKNLGFTIIELTIAIAILCVLGAVAIPRIQSYNAHARGTKIISDMRTIDSAASIYHARTGMFPSNLDNLTNNNVNANPPSYALVTVDEAPNGNKFIVTRANGVEREFSVASGTTYILIDGLSTYGGDGRTVAWYLNGSDLALILDRIRDWEASYVKTSGSGGDRYMAGQYAFNTSGLVHELTVAEIAELCPGIDTSTVGQLYLKSATVVQQDGTLANVQYVTTYAGIGPNRPAHYTSVAMIVNGTVYASVNSSNVLISTYSLPNSGFNSIAQAVQHVAVYTTVDDLVTALLVGGFKPI